MNEPDDKKIRDKLLENSEVLDTGCRIWKHKLHHSGYAYIKIAGRSYSAHRLSYVSFKGSIPNEMCVCHSCDIRHCINPDHLWLGSYKDNVLDMRSKGRGKLHNGQFNEMSKLKPGDFPTIHALLGEGMSQRAVGEIYGVQQPAISALITGRSWGGLGKMIND